MTFRLLTGSGSLSMALSAALSAAAACGGTPTVEVEVDPTIAVASQPMPTPTAIGSVSVSASASESVAPGLNDRFTAPGLDVQEWAERFEVESREVYAARQAITDALTLQPGDVVADVGAGTGLFIPLFSAAVGNQGVVHAVDISESFITHLTERAASTGLTNVRTVLSEPADVMLAEDSVDVVFTSDTYHHFEYPTPTLQSIARALRPGGELIIVDFERIEGVSSDFILRHVRAPKEVVIAEIEAEGFRLVEEVTSVGLVENYMLRFVSP
jgi:ubiquinone/menaquinone biosynthesis C-methylase UbiE